MRRASPALLTAALAAAVALVAGTATLCPRDHPTIAPAGAPAATATQPAPDRQPSSVWWTGSWRPAPPAPSR
jgi:hypothetical protein